MLEGRTRREKLQEMIHFEAGRYDKAITKEARAWRKARRATLGRQACEASLRLLKAELRKVANGV